MKFVSLGDVQISIWETRVQDYEAFCRATGRRYASAISIRHQLILP